MVFEIKCAFFFSYYEFIVCSHGVWMCSVCFYSYAYDAANLDLYQSGFLLLRYMFTIVIFGHRLSHQYAVCEATSSCA